MRVCLEHRGFYPHVYCTERFYNQIRFLICLSSMEFGVHIPEMKSILSLTFQHIYRWHAILVEFCWIFCLRLPETRWWMWVWVCVLSHVWLCVCLCVHACMHAYAQSCLTLGGPMYCSLPGSSVHGIVQARILEWVAISYSRGSSRLRNWTRVSCISCMGRLILYHLSSWETLKQNNFLFSQ